jgi:hypothetical protein
MRLKEKTQLMNTRLASLTSLIGLVLALTGCGRAISNSDKDTSKANRDRPDKNSDLSKPATLQTAMQILEWLPVDTETFIVANGPFQLHREEEDSRRTDFTLEELLQGQSCAPLRVRKGELIKVLAEQKVALAVEGARRFQGPKELGSSLYEGCHVLVFERDLEAKGDSLRKALAAVANNTLEIDGHEVFCVEEKYEKDLWTFFFVQPNPNILLCATDQGFLGEVLNRMDRPGEKRALPKDLPEWEHVDATARYWAIRHYDHRSTLGILGIEPEDVGLVFIFDLSNGRSEKAPPTVKFLTGDNDLGRFEKEWEYEGEAKLTPEVRQLAPGVIEIKAHLRKVDDAGRFFFVLLYHLGHGISV